MHRHAADAGVREAAGRHALHPHAARARIPKPYSLTPCHGVRQTLVSGKLLDGTRCTRTQRAHAAASRHDEASTRRVRNLLPGSRMLVLPCLLAGDGQPARLDARAMSSCEHWEHWPRAMLRCCTASPHSGVLVLCSVHSSSRQAEPALGLETTAHAMAQAREATAALATAEELQRCRELVAERGGGEHSAPASERGTPEQMESGYSVGGWSFVRPAEAAANMTILFVPVASQCHVT